jgi:hypothetical protein
MAISELLHASMRFIDYVRLVLRLRASSRSSPIYSANPLRRAVISTPVVPAGALNDFFPADAVFAATPRRSTTTGSPPIQNKRGVLSKLQCSLYATARTLCLPCSGQDFYFRAFAGGVTPKACVGYHFMAHRLLPWPDLPRPDWQPYGLQWSLDILPSGLCPALDLTLSLRAVGR